MTPELAERIIADSRDRVGWLRARSRGITATDVATLTSERAIARAADTKLRGSGFTGNAYTGFTFEDFKMQKPSVSVILTLADSIRLEYDFALQRAK